jgi:hypothetical protein
MQRKKRTFTNTKGWAIFKAGYQAKEEAKLEMDEFVRAFQRLSLSD